MTTGLVYTIVFGILTIGAIILGIVVSKQLKNEHDIELVQEKLENSDLSIADAIPYLKITNEWGRQ